MNTPNLSTKFLASIYIGIAITAVLIVRAESEVEPEPSPLEYHVDYATAECRAPRDGEIRGTFDWCREGRCSTRCSVMPLDEDASAAHNNAAVKKQAFRL